MKLMSKIRRAVIILCALSASAFFVYLGSMKWLKVKEVKVRYDWLPNEINGLRILQISDLHSNDNEKMNVDIWKAIDKLEYDFAVITGDMTVYEYNNIQAHLDGIKNLAMRTPVYFVEGNHDTRYYKKFMAILKDIGVIILNNETVQLYEGKLELTGYRDFSYLEKTGNLHIEDELEFNPDSFQLALYHQPQFYDYLLEKPDLSICGHTHGGQIRLPFFPTLYAPGQGWFPKYGDGLYEFGQSKIYISRGIGTTVFPVRFYNRPEIAVIEITAD